MANEQQLPLAGKVALVTGSSQGIGRATAQRLAQAGADIVVNYRSNNSAAAEAQASIEALGRRCIAIQADVSQEADVSRLFTEAAQELGPITILVNNAGTTRDKLILQMSLADFEYVMNINLRAAFLCTKAALRGMMKARGGRTEQQRKFMLETTPLGRFGTTDEVAAAISFLCLPEAGYITGQTLSVDGGMTMHI